MALPIGTPRPCKGCGKSILKLKFCTNACRVGWYERTKDQRWREYADKLGHTPWRVRYPEASLKLAERQCEHCGVTFVRRQRMGDATRYCSRDCAFTRQREMSDLRDRIEREASIYRRWAAQAKRKPSGKRCRDCQRRVLKGAQRCPACRAEVLKQTRLRARSSEAGRAAKRRAKAWRRAIERGAGIERFDPFEIFERDKWRCHMCGIKTPKRLRGTYEDNAPELDHVVPLAAGGEHSRRNCACSCRKCNHSKGSKPLGQMLLVA